MQPTGTITQLRPSEKASARSFADAVRLHLETVLREHPEHGWDPVRIRRRSFGGDASSLAALIRQLAAERVSVVVVSPESLGVSESRW